jgi:hypothetical protein
MCEEGRHGERFGLWRMLGPQELRMVSRLGLAEPADRIWEG